ncbi:MAG: hypothetical protein CMK07_07965 [Ponticaulis sp.]|nr:hypothetical protein [Ponticaulis sp.]
MSDFTPIIRGLQRKCPACGEGKLFQGYLKLVPECAECGQAFSHERAADGPAWLTVLMLGPIFAPIIFITAMTAKAPIWVIFPLLGLFMLSTALSVLAFVKGGWIGALWRMDQRQASD